MRRVFQFWQPSLEQFVWEVARYLVSGNLLSDDTSYPATLPIGNLLSVTSYRVTLPIGTLAIRNFLSATSYRVTLPIGTLAICQFISNEG